VAEEEELEQKWKFEELYIVFQGGEVGAPPCVEAGPGL
jgi:hypothetical protein